MRFRGKQRAKPVLESDFLFLPAVVREGATAEAPVQEKADIAVAAAGMGGASTFVVGAWVVPPYHSPCYTKWAAFHYDQDRSNTSCSPNLFETCRRVFYSAISACVDLAVNDRPDSSSCSSRCTQASIEITAC